MLRDRGIYEPLAWTCYAFDGQQQESTLLQIMVEVCDPNDEDLRRITSGMRSLPADRVTEIVKQARATLPRQKADR